ncbi:MAG: Hint domain-containing protein [Rhodobacter sp.]|nr:Hint domain-containing protein [Rhodobacter sp.]
MGELTLTFDTAEAVVDAAPVQGITAGTPVLTLAGELPVQFLAPGDRVITRSGAKVLKDIEVVVVRDAAMVRISASALGHDRPEDDLFVAPSQPILVRDWRAKALYNQDVAMVEAQRLADGDYIRHEVVAEVRLFTLRFERDEVVYAGGLELACAPATVAA